MRTVEGIEYVFTVGMDEADVARHLASVHTGVLSLAAGDEAYAVPVSFHYEDGRLFFRLADDGDARKLALIERTTRATFVAFDTDGEDESWSVLVRGPVHEVDLAERIRFDTATLNDRFAPLRLFDEAVEDVVVRVCEMDVEELSARKTG